MHSDAVMQSRLPCNIVVDVCHILFAQTVCSVVHLTRTLSYLVIVLFKPLLCSLFSVLFLLDRSFTSFVINLVLSTFAATLMMLLTYTFSCMMLSLHVADIPILLDRETSRDVVSVLNVSVSRRSRDVFLERLVSSRSCDLTSCGHPWKQVSHFRTEYSVQ